ncbi:HNH endonuclease signature motif containing protein [Dyella ginsengisoli]|uniref:HNH endonuclease signature motif containing protein n=1 Tax=Dyella ginsengisoli TaxID=363848 RepID=UPI00036F7768|nr:HNH endonuclease signature motif containing protein [Dyella ginsengisoli]
MATEPTGGSTSAAIEPDPALGANFEVAPRRALELSARSVFAGEAAPSGWEPEVESGTERAAELEELRLAVLQRDGRCVYCGARSSTLELDTINDNHHDLLLDNHVAADPLCHGYHHLDDLTAQDARLAYLPGLDPTDVNHLQRVAIATLYEGDPQDKADARDVINWLASHHQYMADAVGTSAPDVLGSVLRRVDPAVKARRTNALAGVALVFSPLRMQPHAGVWMGEFEASLPRAQWGRFFNDVTRSPA